LKVHSHQEFSAPQTQVSFLLVITTATHFAYAVVTQLRKSIED